MDVTLVHAVRARAPRVPLGPLYLSAVLEEHGYEVGFRDYQLARGGRIGTPGHFLSWLGRSAPILGVGVLSSSLPLVLSSLRRRGPRDPAETVVLGGPGVSRIGHLVLERFPEVDVVVEGEGEATLLEVVRRIEEGRSLHGVPGLSFRDGDRVVRNGLRRRIDDLGALPFPAYHHVDLARYTDGPDDGPAPVSVLSARGCPFACSFCDIPGTWPAGIRYREVDDVVDELAMLREERGVARFGITDDTFVFDRARVLAFCDALEARGLVMPWTCLGRVERCDEPLLRRLAEVGCERIFFGIESGSDRVLHRVGKGFDVSLALRVVEASTRHMATHVSFMWGFPFETLDDFHDTLVAMVTMFGMGAIPGLNLLAPLPSAKLPREHREGRTALLTADVGWGGTFMDDYAYAPELLELVRAHPDVFAPFYCLDSPDFGRKVEILDRWGLGHAADPGGRCVAPRTAWRPPPPPANGRLPAVSTDALLRHVGGRDRILDLGRALVYEPSASWADVFEACRAGEERSSLERRLARASGRGPHAAAAFVDGVLARLDALGLLSEAPRPARAGGDPAGTCRHEAVRT